MSFINEEVFRKLLEYGDAEQFEKTLNEYKNSPEYDKEALISLLNKPIKKTICIPDKLEKETELHPINLVIGLHAYKACDDYLYYEPDTQEYLIKILDLMIKNGANINKASYENDVFDVITQIIQCAKKDPLKLIEFVINKDITVKKKHIDCVDKILEKISLIDKKRSDEYREYIENPKNNKLEFKHKIPESKYNSLELEEVKEILKKNINPYTVPGTVNLKFISVQFQETKNNEVLY